MRVWPLIATFLVSGITLGSPAFAQVPAAQTQAEEHIQKGLESRRSGDDLAALAEYETAYRLFPTPRGAAQLGLCNHALGRWIESQRYISEALRAKKDPWVIKNREILSQSLEAVKTRIGFVALQGDPAGASVKVNGAVVGQLPLSAPIRVVAGDVEVSVRAPGYRSWQSTVAVKGGESSELFVTLEKEPIQNAVPALEHIPGDTGMVPVAHGQVDHDLSPQANSGGTKSWYARPWVWIGAAVVVTTIVTAAIVASSGGERRLLVECPECAFTTGVPVK